MKKMKEKNERKKTWTFLWRPLIVKWKKQLSLMVLNYFCFQCVELLQKRWTIHTLLLEWNTLLSKPSKQVHSTVCLIKIKHPSWKVLHSVKEAEIAMRLHLLFKEKAIEKCIPRTVSKSLSTVINWHQGKSFFSGATRSEIRLGGINVLKNFFQKLFQTLAACSL